MMLPMFKKSAFLKELGNEFIVINCGLLLIRRKSQIYFKKEHQLKIISLYFNCNFI